MTGAADLGPWARLPAAWTRTATRRRLLFVASCSPGLLMAVVGTEAAQDPRWLTCGLGLVLVAAFARRHSEPRFLARNLSDTPSRQNPTEPSHDHCA
jgi:hypothetical protein